MLAAFASLSVVEPELYGAIARCGIIQETGFWDVLLAMEVDPLTCGSLSPSGGALGRFHNFLNNRYNHRNEGSLCVLEPTPQAVQLHREFSLDAARACENATHAERAALNLLPVLIWKLAMLESMERIPEGSAVHALADEILRHAIGRALRLVRPGVALKRRLEQRADWAGVGAEALVDLVARVRLRGRCSARDLQRSYHCQRINQLRPRLEEAVQRGLIEEDAGVYSLPRLQHGGAGSPP